MSLLSRLAGTDEARPQSSAADGSPAPATAVPSVHGSMLMRFGAPVMPVRSR